MKKNKILIIMSLIIFIGTFFMLNNLFISMGNNKVVKNETSKVLSAMQKKISDNPVPKLTFEFENSTSLSSTNFNEEMAEDEIEFFYNTFSESENNVITLSREFSENEYKKKLLLEDNYDVDGLRPLKELLFEKCDFYYGIKEDTLYLPPRELTDEEILQIILFTRKINYALSSKINNEKNFIFKDNDYAITLGKEAILKLFNANIELLDCSASYFEATGENGSIYLFRAVPSRAKTMEANNEEYYQYAVFIDSITGIVLDIKRSYSKYVEIDINQETIENILNNDLWLIESEKILIEYNNEILIKNVDFMINKTNLNDEEKIYHENNFKKGYIDIKIELNDDSYYILALLYPNKEIKNLSYYPNT